MWSGGVAPAYVVPGQRIRHPAVGDRGLLPAAAARVVLGCRVRRVHAHGGIVAPEDFNPFAWMEAPDPDGADATRRDTRGGFPSPERQLGIDGPELAAMINGGTEVEYGVRMRPGDVITAVSRLAEYSERRAGSV